MPGQLVRGHARRRESQRAEPLGEVGHDTVMPRFFCTAAASSASEVNGPGCGVPVSLPVAHKIWVQVSNPVGAS